MPQPHKPRSSTQVRKLTHANAKPTRYSSQQGHRDAPKQSTNSIKACDFDGTLAKEQVPYDLHTAGLAIPRTIKLVKKWMRDKEQIVIFTSRVSPSAHNNLQIRYARKLISAWCTHYLGRSFPITSDKHPRMEIWDNRSHRVETDTGRVLAQAKIRMDLDLDSSDYQPGCDEPKYMCPTCTGDKRFCNC